MLRLETALWHDAPIGVIRGIRPVDAGLSREIVSYPPGGAHMAFLAMCVFEGRIVAAATKMRDVGATHSAGSSRPRKHAS